MSSISVADRVIASREYQTQSAYSDCEAVQTELAATRGVDPDQYKKTFELPDKHDLRILSSRNGDLHRENSNLIFGFLTHDMAKTNNPLSNSYRDAKLRLARHHTRYGIRPTVDPSTKKINGWTDCTELEYPLFDTSCPLSSDVPSGPGAGIEGLTEALQVTNGEDVDPPMVFSVAQQAEVVEISFECSDNGTHVSGGSCSNAGGQREVDRWEAVSAIDAQSGSPSP